MSSALAGIKYISRLFFLYTKYNSDDRASDDIIEILRLYYNKHLVESSFSVYSEVYSLLVYTKSHTNDNRLPRITWSDNTESLSLDSYSFPILSFKIMVRA